MSWPPLSRRAGSCQYTVLVQGVSRIRVLSLAEEGPMLHGTVVRLQDQGSITDPEVGGLGVFCPRFRLLTRSGLNLFSGLGPVPAP